MIMGRIQWSGASGCCWNCCGRTVATTLSTQRNLVDMWFRGLSPSSPLFRTTAGQKRERERPNKLCVFPAALLRFQLVHRILFYGNVFVHDRCHHRRRWKWIVHSRERPNKLCIFLASNPCTYPAAWAQDLILRECLHAWGTSESYRETSSMLCSFLFLIWLMMIENIRSWVMSLSLEFGFWVLCLSHEFESWEANIFFFYFHHHPLSTKATTEWSRQ